jgi:hypothetical protein
MEQHYTQIKTQNPTTKHYQKKKKTVQKSNKNKKSKTPGKNKS